MKLASLGVFTAFLVSFPAAAHNFLTNEPVNEAPTPINTAQADTPMVTGPRSTPSPKSTASQSLSRAQ